MKTKSYLFIIVLAGSLSFLGCEKNACVGCKFFPIHCDGYAPEEIYVSWTDYNSVDAIANYFRYVNTCRQHERDTVRLYGYILGYDDSNYYRSKFENPDHGIISLYISENPKKQFVGRGEGHACILDGIPEHMEWLTEYKAGQKVYVTSLIHASNPWGDSQCFWSFHIKAIDCIVEK